MILNSVYHFGTSHLTKDTAKAVFCQEKYLKNCNFFVCIQLAELAIMKILENRKFDKNELTVYFIKILTEMTLSIKGKSNEIIEPSSGFVHGFLLLRKGVFRCRGWQ